MYHAIVELSGAGESRYRAFLARLAVFHKEWREFFLTRARGGVSRTPADYDAFPHFPDFEALSDASGNTLLSISLGLASPTLALAFLTLRGLRRLQP
jgi:ABC-2 type transport system permease protein